MPLVLRQILTTQELLSLGAKLEGAEFASGLETAGPLSARVKRNLQLPATTPLAREVIDVVTRALRRSRAFHAAALPHALSEPRVNRYELGMSYGAHVDHGLMGGATPLRSDLAVTLFLSEPDTYDGGELIIDDDGAPRSFKLPAGDLVLYPASTIHRVETVRRGTRHAVILWVQSMIASASHRRILLDLERVLATLIERDPDADEVVTLSAVYHNLLREWAQP